MPLLSRKEVLNLKLNSIDRNNLKLLAQSLEISVKNKTRTKIIEDIMSISSSIDIALIDNFIKSKYDEIIKNRERNKLISPSLTSPPTVIFENLGGSQLVTSSPRSNNIENKRVSKDAAYPGKICVVIDEAHIFIDEKHNVSLDFMYSLAKRIRKYDGMLIVITQNIKDFSGSVDTLRKTSAIINASQYSLIFSLNPGDIKDLTDLYSKAGEISDIEREEILRSKRGRALLITTPTEKTFVDILATNKTSKLWEE